MGLHCPSDSRIVVYIRGNGPRRTREKPMARKRSTTVVVPTTFVGTFYDTNAGVYVATRKDGSITVGQTGKRGLNVQVGAVGLDAAPIMRVEH